MLELFESFSKFQITKDVSTPKKVSEASKHVSASDSPEVVASS